ncbi:FAD-binding protein [Halobacteriaceae archaeon GCM10025711]
MHDVLIVGGGVAGRSAAIFTARAGLDTLVVSHDESILRRNAHLENYPGFPAGVDARLLLSMMRDQAERAGVAFTDDRVVDVAREADGFAVTGERSSYEARRVIAASWAESGYLDGLDVEREQRGSKQFVVPDEAGHTNVDGLYAAGRLAAQYHQTVVAAGHGAQVGLTVVHDSDVPFYHDWVVPEGYFTGRGREVPPGCEEIDEAERGRRERASREVMQAYFAEPHPGKPTQHPSVRDAEASE